MSQWSSEFVNTNGIQIHFNRTGGGGKPLILAHGITDNGLCWTRLAKSLELEYDILMIDARGHGNSGAYEKGYQKQDHAEDLAGLIETLELANQACLAILWGRQMSRRWQGITRI